MSAQAWRPSPDSTFSSTTSRYVEQLTTKDRMMKEKKNMLTISKEYASQRESCHFCQLRAFPTHKTIPVTIVNEVDQAVIPPNFRFVDRMVLRPGVEPAEDSFRSGCACESDAACQYMGCLCLADLDDQDSDSDEDDDDGHRIANQLNGDGHEAVAVSKDRTKRKAYAYHSHGAKAGLLRSKMLSSKEPLYECHAGCSCSMSCPNRVVERGRTVPLQIFRTPDRGWGESSFSKHIDSEKEHMH